MDTTKVGLGAFLLVVSSVLLLAIGANGTGIPVLLGGVAALGMAAGSLLIGVTNDGPTV
ncbi:hypothetical protein [Natronoarchaeum rubrum]|uniref:hypothetical protein n=1 Tax=Natronoarchaeum rubrum TaxID=755311 RepID=UPI002112BDB1|nr:hypothetical protein [Natronoarchaeum rubrum]HMB51293.1 hypothetical protein [Natronoarchaeum rubrum]